MQWVLMRFILFNFWVSSGLGVLDFIMFGFFGGLNPGFLKAQLDGFWHFSGF